MSEFPQALAAMLGGRLGGARAESVKVFRLRDSVNTERLLELAKRYTEETSVEVGNLVTWKKDLVPEHYVSQPPLIGVVVDIPPRPANPNVDAVVASVMINGHGDEPFIAEFPLRRMRAIDPMEVDELLTAWIANNENLKEHMIQELMAVNLDERIPATDRQCETAADRKLERGDIVIHRHGSRVEVGIYAGVAEDSDPAILVHNGPGGIDSENPPWCCWRKATDEELAEYNCTRQQAEAYKMSLSATAAIQYQ